MFELRKLIDGDEVLVLPYPEKGESIILDFEVIKLPNSSSYLFYNSKHDKYSFYRDISSTLRSNQRSNQLHIFLDIKIFFGVCNNKLCVIKWHQDLYDIWMNGVKRFASNGTIIGEKEVEDTPDYYGNYTDKCYLFLNLREFFKILPIHTIRKLIIEDVFDDGL